MTAESNRRIWGLAKCDELQLTSEELHLIVMRLTGKESLRQLTDRESKKVILELGIRRDKERGKVKRGNESTEYQRKKVFKLMQSLGWDEKRINGMCRRMFKISAVEWLDYRQCSKLIEALKAMDARKEAGDGKVLTDQIIEERGGECGS